MNSKKLVNEWSIDDVASWVDTIGLTKYKTYLCKEHHVDGKALMLMTEDDLRRLKITALGDVKRLYSAIMHLQISNDARIISKYYKKSTNSNDFFLYVAAARSRNVLCTEKYGIYANNSKIRALNKRYVTHDNNSADTNSEGFRTFIGILYWCFGLYLTAFVMTLTHDRHPDPKRYPPLPDVVFEIIPLIPSAFQWAESCCVFMSMLAILLLIFHKHRLILLRRAAVLSATIFIFRCVTMYTTSLSVPDMSWSKHCTKKFETFENRIKAANKIFLGCGMMANDVFVCGDYLYSGHTASLTLMCLFIIQFTPRRWHHLHYFCWFMNFLTMFLILASHLHYTIDVVISFFITLRMFYSYHTLASTVQVRSIDEERRRKWYPLWSFFEHGTPLVIHNEFELPITLQDLRFYFEWLDLKFKYLIEKSRSR